MNKKVSLTLIIFWSFFSTVLAEEVSILVDNGKVTASKLTTTNALPGHIFRYNGTGWNLETFEGINFMGEWNASTNSPDLTALSTGGHIYVVSTAGTTDLQGGEGTNSWAVGDWAIYSSISGQWEKAPATVNTVSFNGRSGDITPTDNDYTWAQIDKSSSSLGDIANVDLSGAITGQVLKYNGSSWVPDYEVVGSGYNSIDTSLIANDTLTNDDFNSVAAIDQSKINSLTTDLSAKISLTEDATMTGDLNMSSQNIITSGTVAGIDISALDAQVTALTTSAGTKQNTLTPGTSLQYLRADKTYGTLSTEVLGFAISGFATGSNTQVATTDSFEIVLENLQGQIDGNNNTISGKQLPIATSDSFTVHSITTVDDGTMDATGDFSVGGDLKVNGLQFLTHTITYPSGGANDNYHMFEFASTYGAMILHISAIFDGPSMSKKYIVATTNNGTSGSWRYLVPFKETDPYHTIDTDFELTININGNTTTVGVVRTAGTGESNVTLSVRVSREIANTFGITKLSTSNSDSVSSTYIPGESSSTDATDYRCSAAYEGSKRWNSVMNVEQICDGTNWLPTPWIPFSFGANWAADTNYGTDTPGYKKASDGNVHLRGKLIGSGTCTDTIATLPTGFRPANSLKAFFTLTYSKGTTLTGSNLVEVDATNGNIVQLAATGDFDCSTDGISLDGRFFSTTE